MIKQSGNGVQELFIPVLYLISGKALSSRKRNNLNLKINKRPNLRIKCNEDPDY
jgi:hypothetical protein